MPAAAQLLKADIAGDFDRGDAQPERFSQLTFLPADLYSIGAGLGVKEKVVVYRGIAMIGNTTAELVKRRFLMAELKGVQAGDLTVRGAAVDGQGHFVTPVF